jgi:transposase
MEKGRFSMLIDRRGWRYPENFRRMAVERFKCRENIEWLARELGVPRQTLYRWHEESERNAEEGEPIAEKSRESRLRRESRELKRLVAKQEVAVRSEVQKIALEHRGQYGYRRITAELQAGD